MKYINNKSEVYEADVDVQIIRHTTAHILAQAVKRLYPEAKLAIGPAIDTGFYYDIDLDYHLTDEDLVKLEESDFSLLCSMFNFKTADFSGCFFMRRNRKVIYNLAEF